MNLLNIFKKSKNLKLKNNIRGLTIFFLIIFGFVLIYIFSNFRRFNTIILNGNNNDFYITNGVMIYTPGLNLIKIDDIKYNNTDFMIENISFELSYNGENNQTIKTIDYISKEPVSLKEYLKTIRINISNQLTKKIINGNNKLVLKIDIYTTDKRILNYEIILNQSKTTNDQLLYF